MWMSANKRSLSQTLDCQTLIRRGAFSSRGTIPANFTPAQPPDLNYICMKSQSHYETWLTTRYFSNKVGEIENIPSFLNMNSFLHDTVQQKQKSHLLLFNRALQQSMIPSILLCVIFKMFFFRCPSQMVHFGAMKVCIGWQRNSSFWNLDALTTYFWVKGVFIRTKLYRMLWGILGRYRNRFNSRRKRSLWSRKCQTCH